MDRKSQILVIGSGGVGTMAAYALETGNLATVTIVCRSNFSTVQSNGFTIDSIEHGHNITSWRPTRILPHVPSATDDAATSGPAVYDYIVVATKNIPDVSPVADLIGPAVRDPATAIVLLQNGLNIEEPIHARFPSHVVLSAVSLISATVTGPATVRHDDVDVARCGPFVSRATTGGAFLVAAAAAATARAQDFVARYNAGGRVRWEFDGNVRATRWRKLVYNASFNSVSAMLGGMDTVRMRMSGAVIEGLVKPAMREVVRVARADGVSLSEKEEVEGFVDRMVRTDPLETWFVPSMGQDARRGALMEVETIVGEPVREAAKLGVDVPVLRTLYAALQGLQLKAKERQGLWKAEWEEGNPYGP
jgi:2-dehydropantoate 2-reductase